MRTFLAPTSRERRERSASSSSRRRGRLTSALVLLATPAALGCGDGDPASGAADPMFFNLGFDAIGAEEAVLSFDTRVETSCEAELGDDAESFDRRYTDPNMDPDNPYDVVHEVPLTGLQPQTQYWVRARAVDRDGVEYLSEPLRFTTSALDADAGDNGGVPEDLENFARTPELATVTEVSSVFGGTDYDGAWGIHKALDGSPASEWSTQGDGDDAYVVLDLGELRSIRRFAFQSRKMADGTSIVRSVRLMLDSGAAIGPLPTPDPDTMYRFDFDPPLAARVVRLDAVETTGGNTGAKEIQLWGASR